MTQKNLNQETAKIEWSALQRFFASGVAVYIAPEIDLVDAANAFSDDDKQQVSLWMKTNKVQLVSAQQAEEWIKNDPIMWSVVIKPWVLVQPT
jgi:hypothetical protein